MDWLSKELQTRIITGLTMAAGFLAIVIWAGVSIVGRWSLLAAGFVLVSMACFEFVRICGARSSAGERFGMSFLVALLRIAALWVPLLVAFYMYSSQLVENSAGEFVGGLSKRTVLPVMFSFFLAWVLAGATLVLSGRSTLASATQVARELFLGIGFLTTGGIALFSLILLPGGVQAVLWLLVVVCLNDIGAYFTGKKVGGPRLAPVISPGKTCSGSVGGIIAGGVAGMAGCLLLPTGVTISCALSIAIFVVVAAQTGDLLKSYIKRLYDVKDSGAILPGHGGVLDRIDGVIMAAPVFLIFVLYAGG